MEKVYLVCERSATYRRTGINCQLFSEDEIKDKLFKLRCVPSSENYLVSNAYRLESDARYVCDKYNNTLSVCSRQYGWTGDNGSYGEVILTVFDYFVLVRELV